MSSDCDDCVGSDCDYSVGSEDCTSMSSDQLDSFEYDGMSRTSIQSEDNRNMVVNRQIKFTVQSFSLLLAIYAAI